MPPSFSSRFLTPSSTEVTTDKMRLKRSAHQKPSTSKPSTSFDDKIMMKALMTRRNSPKLKTVTGMVRMIMMGFTTAFKNDNTAATISAVKKLLSRILTCGNKYDVIKTASVEMMS